MWFICKAVSFLSVVNGFTVVPEVALDGVESLCLPDNGSEVGRILLPNLDFGLLQCIKLRAHCHDAIPD